jgi:DNA-binding NtrC family response regulator
MSIVRLHHMEDGMAEKNVVLFVDDDPLVLKAILRHFSWHQTLSPLAVLNAGAALELLDSTHVDVVVGGGGVSSVDSVELLKTVRQKHPRTACVILSGLLDSYWLSRALQLTKVEELIGKPFYNDRPHDGPAVRTPRTGGLTPLIEAASPIEPMMHASVN